MSLSDIASTTNSDVLPGYVLSKWRLKEYADAENEFRESFLRESYAASVSLPAESQERAIDRANKYVGEGNLDYGTRGFKLRLFSARALPFLLWLSLRKLLPEMTREQVASLLTDNNEPQIKAAILKLLGYGGQSPKKETPAQAQSTGESSIALSANGA